MYHTEMEHNGVGGIYIIVNILGGRAYIGQAVNLSARTHKSDLENNREPNMKLAQDFADNAELIFFPVLVGTKESDALNCYEALYMTVVEDHGGFELHNSDKQPLRANRRFEILEKNDIIISQNISCGGNFIEQVKKQFDEDFKLRFGATMKELSHADSTAREDALKHYMQVKDKIPHTSGYFTKDSFIRKYDIETKSIKDLDLGRMIVTSAGTYLKEGIEEILSYEIPVTKNPDLGYCLWTFGNKINTQFGRRFCREWCEKDEKDIYLLIRYTGSQDHSESIDYNHFNREDFNNLSGSEKKLLLGKNCTEEDIAQLNIPKEINSTGTSKARHGFVITDFYLVKEHFNFTSLVPQFNSIVKTKSKNPDVVQTKLPGGGYLKSATDSLKKGHCDTVCLQLKEGNHVVLPELSVDDSDTTDFILAKLAAPYIVDIVE